MYRSKPRDEEEHLLAERALLLQHKQELEMQQAMYGPANRPSHLPVQIARLEQDIKRVDRRISNARRKKRLKATMQQVSKAGQILTNIALPPSVRGRRSSYRRSQGPSTVVTFIGIVVIICFIAAVGNFLPNLSGRYMQVDAAPLVGQILPEATAVLLPTMPALQATAMAIGAWPPPDAEHRVIGATGRIGVKLRINPQQNSHNFTVLKDGTLVYLIEKTTDEGGAVWWWVALSDGTTGYVNEQYLLIP